MEAVEAYIEKHKDRFLNELIAFLRIPSISADPAHKDDVRKSAEVIKQYLIDAGVEKVEIHETAGHPIVLGSHVMREDYPTVVVYGHYDVQPPDPLALWDSPPFEPVIKKTNIHPDGALFARGSCDDKGQLFMHVKAFERLMQAGDLRGNVKFLFEGEP